MKYRHTKDRMPLCRTAVLLALVMMMSACGFQPRGNSTDLSQVPTPLYISGIAYHSDLHRELRRQLRRAGVTVAETAEDGALLLRISEHDTDSRLLSLDSRNRAIETELEESVWVSAYDRAGNERLAPQQIRVLRILYRPPKEILGAGREAELLRADMRKEIAQRIMDRLATLD